VIVIEGLPATFADVIDETMVRGPVSGGIMLVAVERPYEKGFLAKEFDGHDEVLW
jgi:hypothetical protein